MNGFDFFLQTLPRSAGDATNVVKVPKAKTTKVVSSRQPERPAEQSLGNVTFLSARRNRAA